MKSSRSSRNTARHPLLSWRVHNSLRPTGTIDPAQGSTGGPSLRNPHPRAADSRCRMCRHHNNGWSNHKSTPARCSRTRDPSRPTHCIPCRNSSHCRTGRRHPPCCNTAWSKRLIARCRNGHCSNPCHPRTGPRCHPRQARNTCPFVGKPDLRRSSNRKWPSTGDQPHRMRARYCSARRWPRRHSKYGRRHPRRRLHRAPCHPLPRHAKTLCYRTRQGPWLKLVPMT
jgi:hypothetical protein